MKQLIVLLSIVSLCVGCAKKSNEPSDPVLGFFKAIDQRDSAGVMNVMSLSMKKAIIENGDTTMSRWFAHAKGRHIDLKIKKVVLESYAPNVARVYVLETFKTDSSTRTYDSIYYSVYKEDDVWKLGSIGPYQDPSK